MLRATALLIVTALAGTPMASLACELWCSTAAAEAHQRAAGCHQEPEVPATEQLVGTVDCHDAAAGEPFLTEARAGRSAPLPAVHAVPVRHGAAPPFEHVAKGWHVFEVPSSPPSSLHTVLRT